ncbi:mechanosensitive ion channel family protein [Roseateles koreensis]|uniref:Mechanosensitive ion channel n=1 Tax=Roseateles koreensis TaxID=2987526 RepID=A0ABT5KYV2_9BURK|nr:mechanosensitive ion channel domain-containing protein [Roseateles koreensis]MDC8786981.1 mechanosensitive ion channel [Roseateles koreensis]
MNNNDVFDFGEFQALLLSLLTPTALMGFAVLLACLGVSWLLVRMIYRRVEQHAASVMFGRHVVDGVLFPVLALVLVMIAKRSLPLIGVSPAAFKLAVPVLVFLVVIRLAVRVLGAAFPTSTMVKAIERTVSWLAWGGSILWVTGILPFVLNEFDGITWKMGGGVISLRNVIEGLFNAIIVLVVSLWISSMLEARILGGKAMDLSLRKIGANAVRAVFLLGGLLIALSSAGIDLTALGVLGGALGVGIGFGLQKLASNYVSGFVILAERSLRIGDMVKVDNFEGRISDINTRYTVIRALSGREAILPNEMLITQRVENMSLADPQVLLSTSVGVAYGTDLDALMPQMVAAAMTVPRVLAIPAPSVLLSNFGPDSLELTLNFWISDPHNGQGGPRSEVNLELLRLFNRIGVEIPFPQRVVHQA